MSDIPAALPLPARRRPSAIWLIPLAAAVLSAGIGIRAWLERGIPIVIRFAAAEGLRAGDGIRHRGVDIGRVDRVQLSADGQGVEVEATLHRRAAGFARTGARFWVVRPQVGLDGVRGLETVVGPRYLGAEPGEGADQRAHVGLDQVPITALPGSLTLHLDAAVLGGLRPGAPLTYRQVAIGRIRSTRLASDGTAVEAEVVVDPPYVGLIRANTVFWDASGIDVSAGLFQGLSVQVDSLSNLVAGGLACATPDARGTAASPGQRYRILGEAPKAWQDWRAPITVGGGLPAGAVPAWGDPLRLTCQYGRWWKRAHVAEGRAAAVPGGWLVPAALLRLPDHADRDTLSLRIGDLDLAPPEDLGAEPLILVIGPSRPLVLPRRTHRPGEDLVAFADEALGPRPIGAHQMDATGHIPDLDPAWSGALVRGTSDGAWVGMLVVEDRRGRLIPLP